MSITNWHSGARCYVGGRYCHQTPSLFTIITKQIHHRQTTKGKGETEKDNNYMETYRREESSLCQGK